MSRLLRSVSGRGLSRVCDNSSSVGGQLKRIRGTSMAGAGRVAGRDSYQSLSAGLLLFSFAKGVTQVPRREIGG